MLDWLGMGGYAPFVWGAYAIAIGGLGALSLWTVLAHRRLARQAKQISGAP